jgi:D-sedoheptulose 7-phosphate isomerase
MSEELSLRVHLRLEESRKVFSNEMSFPSTDLVNLASRLSIAFKEGKKVAFIGNGGSATEATHLAAEFIGKCVVDHEPLAALSLTDSNAILTAISNDYGVEEIFARQVKALLREGDILVSLSTSGKSLNVLKAIKIANDLGVYTVLWMGDFKNQSEAQETWKVPSTSTPRIQEVHMMWGHILAQAVEETS